MLTLQKRYIRVSLGSGALSSSSAFRSRSYSARTAISYSSRVSNASGLMPNLFQQFLLQPYFFSFTTERYSSSDPYRVGSMSLSRYFSLHAFFREYAYFLEFFSLYSIKSVSDFRHLAILFFMRTSDSSNTIGKTCVRNSSAGSSPSSLKHLSMHDSIYSILSVTSEAGLAKAHSMIFFAVSVCPHSKAVSTRSTTLRRYPTQFVISFSANDGDAAMRLMIAAGNSSG